MAHTHVNVPTQRYTYIIKNKSLKTKRKRKQKERKEDEEVWKDLETRKAVRTIVSCGGTPFIWRLKQTNLYVFTQWVPGSQGYRLRPYLKNKRENKVLGRYKRYYWLRNSVEVWISRCNIKLIKLITVTLSEWSGNRDTPSSASRYENHNV